LKGIAYDMEMEAKDHNKLLGGVDDDFDSAKGLLGGTMNRLNQVKWYIFALSFKNSLHQVSF